MLKKLLYLFLMSLLVLSFSSVLVSAWEYNGTVYDLAGNPLNNTIVNMTMWVMSGGPPQYIGSNATRSFNSTDLTGDHGPGYFTMNVSENSAWSYKPVIQQFNATDNFILQVGQSMPELPYQAINGSTNLKFYLRPAGTINITAINSSSEHIPFNYMVKDIKLGFGVASNWNSTVSQAIIYVPRDRNYSIMIFPQNSLPVSYNWNNFTANQSYTIGLLSNYNATTHTVSKRFNTTIGLVRVTGYINNSQVMGWNQFKMVHFLMEPGNMVFMARGALPYGMSAWNGETDNFTDATGFFNISLPTPAESATFLMFATAKNSSYWFGSYRNLTLTYGDPTRQINFTMYGMLGNGTASTNFSLSDASNWNNQVVVNTSKLAFNLLDTNGNILSNVNAHIEAIVDYSNYGARQMTFMEDISSGAGAFYLPLLNVTGTKEINIYSQTYAPKRVDTKTAVQLTASSNITMNTFNPGDIDGRDISSSVFILMYQSNSTCDVPEPPEGCSIVDSKSKGDFDPLSAVLGGGALSFRMGLTSSGIVVHYVNVDLLASGPPDALFDDSATTSTSGGFSSALRFGSSGPKIYDYLLVSMPYTEGSDSQTGLNENADVNMSIPLLYDEDWNVIWDASTNGTNATVLSANYSHYAGKEAAWDELLNSQNCTRTVSEFNLTNPCYLDTANNRIWIRLPQFSGTRPSISGDTITAASTDADTDTASSSSGGGGGSASTAAAGQYSQQVWDSINKGDVATITVKDDALGITKIEFNVVEKVWGAWLKVTQKEELPNYVQPFTKNIYKKLEISKGPALKDNLIQNGKVDFKVEKVWLAENQLSKESIALFHYVTDAWTELPTTVGVEDDAYVHYSASTPGFSYFVIGEKVIAQAPAAEQATAEQPAVPEATPAVQPASEMKQLNAISWIVTLIVAAVIVAVVIAYFRKRR